MAEYISTQEHAARIRARLKKEHGWTGRQVSVRADMFSLGSAIRCEIKDPDVPLTVVEKIAKAAEHIDRCSITGDILGGGNMYVTVRYSHDAERAVMQRYAPAVQEALDLIGPREGR